ncbi:MAG: hypothetical protein J0I91_10185 [Candidatus Accumulibacter sp.]|nr:hypothetical protein [Accumulibacter sp.]
MELIIPVIIIFTFFIGSFVLISMHLRKMGQRRALPERDAYRQRHGSLACRHCGATGARDYGLDDQNDDKRIVACADCGKDLFQYLSAAAPAAV